MKKTTILAAIAATAIAAIAAGRTPAEIRDAISDIAARDISQAEKSAARVDLLRGMSEAEWRACFDDVLAYAADKPYKEGEKCNSAVYNYAFFKGLNLVNFLGRAKDLPFDSRALCAEYDERFAALHFIKTLPPYAAWPKMTIELMHRARYYELCPTTAAKIEASIAAGKNKCDVSGQTFAQHVRDMAEALAYANDAWGRQYATMSEKFADDLCKRLSKSALKAVKRSLRAKGKSFVAKVGGENPVEAPVNALTDALNAPRFAGLVEWCDEWCPEASAEAARLIAALPGEEAIAALKNGVFVGELDFNSARRAWLRMCLGVEEYNEFIRQYNGD